MKNKQIGIIVSIFVSASLNVFGTDLMHAETAVDAYENLINSEAVASTLHTEEDFDRLVQGYINQFGSEFIFEAVKNYRGKNDLKKGEEYAMSTRYTLSRILSMKENQSELLDELVYLYESDSDEVLRNVSIPFALSGIFYDYELGKFSLTPAESMLKKRQDDLPVQFVSEYMYERPVDAVILMAEVFGTPADVQMVVELSKEISSLWQSPYWPDDVTSFAQATSNAQELLLSISDRDEWWLRLFLKKVLTHKPEWSNPVLKEKSDRPIQYPICEDSGKPVLADRSVAKDESDRLEVAEAESPPVSSPERSSPPGSESEPRARSWNLWLALLGIGGLVVFGGYRLRRR